MCEKHLIWNWSRYWLKVFHCRSSQISQVFHMINRVWTRGRLSVKSYCATLSWYAFVRLKAPGQYLHLWYEYRVNFAWKLTLELYMFWSMTCVFALLKDGYSLITSFFYICEIILKEWVSINHRFVFGVGFYWLGHPATLPFKYLKYIIYRGNIQMN